MSDSNAELVAWIARQTVGHVPASVRRFTTGAQHYVFDLRFADHPPVVVRIGDESAHALMAGAVYLSDLLRPRGVPLPELLAHDTQAERPWLVLERLPGTDLGDVINDLSDRQRDEIARRVAQAQLVASKVSTAGRYGYAVIPDQAPYAAWSQVLDAHLARSRSRIVSAGFFDIGQIESMEAALIAARDQVDAVAPTPFLHDTTTKNVIVTSEGVFSGIVDVDDLCFGDPGYPMALTMAALMAAGRSASYISSWMRYTGQKDDHLFRLYVGLFLLDLMSEHGQSFNGNMRQSTSYTRAALSRAFAVNLPLISG